MVWLGISSQKSTSAVKLRLGKDRIRNKERASTAALNLIRTTLLK
jgi:nicotinamide mononucleotide (NMN) deamidase PncC